MSTNPNAFMMLIRVAVRAPFMLVCATWMAYTINQSLVTIFLIAIPNSGCSAGNYRLHSFSKVYSYAEKIGRTEFIRTGKPDFHPGRKSLCPFRL